MSQFRGGLIDKHDGQDSYTKPGRLSQLKLDHPHMLAGDGNASRLDTLRIKDLDPALLGLPAWSSALDPRSPDRPAFLEEQDQFWKPKETHRARYHARHGRTQSGVAEALAREDDLWQEFDRQARQRKANITKPGSGSTSPPKPETWRRVTIDSPGNTTSSKSSRGIHYEPGRMQWTKGGPYQTPRVDERSENPGVEGFVKVAVPDESTLSSSASPYQNIYGRSAAKTGSPRGIDPGRKQTKTGYGPSQNQQAASGDASEEDDEDSEITGGPGRHDSRDPHESLNKVFREVSGTETSAMNADGLTWIVPVSEKAPLVLEPNDIETDEGPSSPDASQEAQLLSVSKQTARQDVGTGDTRFLSKITDSALIINDQENPIDPSATQSETKDTALPAILSLPSQEDSFGSISNSFGTLLEATGNPYVSISHQ